jgi:hypothetical protein
VFARGAFDYIVGVVIAHDPAGWIAWRAEAARELPSQGAFV